MSNYDQIAKDVVEQIGGKENIQSVAHCATRLRVMVKDESKINKDAVENIDLVKGAFFNSGQYQIIFGTGTVNKVYEAVSALGVSESSTSEMKEEAAKQGNAFQRMSRTFGDVFVPIIPVLVATGLFMGLRGLLTNATFLGFFGMAPEMIDPNFIAWTQILTDTAFAFLPALVSWSTFKVFGGSPVIGLVLGLMLVSNVLPNAYSVAGRSIIYNVNEETLKSIGDNLEQITNGVSQSFTFTSEITAVPTVPMKYFGFIDVVGYQGTVLPAFFVGMLGATLEKKLRKFIPDVLDLLLTPFLTFLIMSVLGLFVIGPFFHAIEVYILSGTQWILNLPFGLAGIIIGGLQQVVVITGVHHIFNFLETQLLATTGANPFNPLLSAATAGQVGAALAVAIKTKDAKIKALAFPSALSAALGITEPAIFGINLRFGKPFVMGLVGGAAGGFLASIFSLKATGMSVTVLPGILVFLTDQLPLYLVVIAVGAAVSFALTFAFGYNDDMLNKK